MELLQTSVGELISPGMSQQDIINISLSFCKINSMDM